MAACPAPDDPIDLGICGERSATHGSRVCVHEVGDTLTWEGITLPGGAVDILRATKYMVPASDDAELPTLFQDANAFVVHLEFMAQVFPDLFPGLSAEEYNALILAPDTRHYYAGALAEYWTAETGSFWGFSVWDDPSDPQSTIGETDVLAAWSEMTAGFALSPVVFVPSNNNQRAAMADWSLPFETFDADAASGVTYEAYTRGVGFGTVRLLDLQGLEAADAVAGFGFQDILVLDEAPADIERVIAGAVTGTRQGELSHLNIRSAGRGTPNCYQRDAHASLGEWEGKLVRMECGADALTVSLADPAEAATWWEELQPDPIELDPPDLTVTAFTGLLEAPTDTLEERATTHSRYGGKGSQLAALYQRIPAQYQLAGFLTPFAFYDAFVRDNTWPVDVDGVEMELTYRQTQELWASDPAFGLDPAYRKERLDALDEHMKTANVDPDLVEALIDEIVTVFGDTTTTVRFRSSSNAEDSLAFTGAGLYASTSVCAADSLDGDEVGPSLCDPDQPQERTVERGLRKVWRSLWGSRAFEERAWFGMEHLDAGMAVLVNTRSKDELAQAVVFTGNPTAPGDDRFLVNAQVGELSVVAPAPGEVVEKDVVTLDASGEVTLIERVRASNQTGSPVLTDDELTEMTELAWQIREDFPVDDPAAVGSTILIDSEWKILSDGRMIIKQARPFARDDATAAP